MKLASVREFRELLTGFTKKKEMVVVTNHGKMVGCFLPLQDTSDLPFELKKEFLSNMGHQIAVQLTANKIPEKEILNDFKEFKKNRRR